MGPGMDLPGIPFPFASVRGRNFRSEAEFLAHRREEGCPPSVET